MEGRGGEGLACAQKLADAVPSLTPFKRRSFGGDSPECAKFDGYPMEHMKNGQEENAVSIDFEFGIQEQGEELQNSDLLDVLKRTTSRAKRTRRIYLQGNAHTSTDSACDPKSSDILPIASTVDTSSLKAAKATCSKSSASGSSSSRHLDDLDSNEACEHSGVSKLCFIQDLKHQNIDETVEKSGNWLAFNAKEIPQSNNLNPLHTNHHTVMGMTLVDVHLTVQASSWAENIPFVSLTSQITGQAILGYPIEVAELSESFETIPSTRKENVQSSFHRLVWRTSRRTPVCYVTNSPSSSISKSLQGRKASETVQDSVPLAKEGHFLLNKDYLTKCKKSTTNGAHRGQGATSRACVPVELVFRKVLAAVSQVNS